MTPRIAPRSLSELRTGDRATITGVSADNSELRYKLLSMGFVEGSALEVNRVAPLGDPISVKVLGFTLSLRLAEASNVFVLPQ